MQKCVNVNDEPVHGSGTPDFGKGVTIMNLLCVLLGHRRSSSKAWHDNLNWRSVCARCKTPMVKDNLSGDWQIAKTDRHA
jgi:hypothetical protein